ncbi:MAG: DUF917 family protein [Granulosicoccus sp.]|jgi:DUF917 family protein
MELRFEDVDDLCTGAAFLGAGGGGDPYIGGLMVKQELASGRTIEIVDPDMLDDSKLVIPTAMMGAPTVLLEKIPSGEEPIRALRLVEKELGRRADATMPTEVGGINSTIPLYVGARLGIPVVDADGQGRAFPELQMETFAIEGISGCPLGISDEKGDTSLVMTDDNHRMEWIARGITIRFGGTAYFANYPMSGADVKRTAVKHTLTLARRIGEIIHNSRRRKQDPFEALCSFLATTSYGLARVIFTGKIVDVDRRTSDGFTLGKVSIDNPSGRCLVEFQNENLIARIDGEVLAIVPDIISILDAETAMPITNETLRYGQRVKVMAVRVPPIMRSDAAIRQFGPPAFGMVDTYRPLN